jgi:hypothetical protein
VIFGSTGNLARNKLLRLSITWNRRRNFRLPHASWASGDTDGRIRTGAMS